MSKVKNLETLENLKNYRDLLIINFNGEETRSLKDFFIPDKENAAFILDDIFKWKYYEFSNSFIQGDISKINDKDSPIIIKIEGLNGYLNITTLNNVTNIVNIKRRILEKLTFYYDEYDKYHMSVSNDIKSKLGRLKLQHKSSSKITPNEKDWWYEKRYRTDGAVGPGCGRAD